MPEIAPNLPLIHSLIATGTIASAYAFLVYRLQRKGRTEGVTSLLVVAGVLFTLLMAAPFAQDIETVLIYFAVSGTPMIVGDIAAYIHRRERGRELFKDDQ